MQIYSVSNTSFGLKFSKGMNNLLNKSRREVEQKNPRSLKKWDENKAAIKKMCDDTFELNLNTFFQKDKARTIEILNKITKKSYPIMTILKDELLDRPYMQILKDNLTELQPILKNSR